MKFGFGLFAFALGSYPALAHDTPRDVLSVPSEAEIAAAQRIADNPIAKIEAGNHEEAIADVLAANPLLATKASEKNLLIGQARTATEVYGPVKRCVLESREPSSELRITFLYVCQHENMLLRWRLVTDHLAGGWNITNISFTDSF